MDEKIAENYIKAGGILRKAQEKARGLLKPGVRLLDVAEKVEAFIIKEKGGLAFPMNLSFNNEAAHNTPAIGDERVLLKEDVLKADMGVHIDGYIADAAFTINLSGEWKELISANELALKEALAVVKEGLAVGEIGAVIEKNLRERGFNPVQNLSGHGLQQYYQHASPSIPNISSRDERKIEEGGAYAIEPFATNGKGFVHEGVGSEIFQADEVKPVRGLAARKIMKFVEEEYKGLPFAERWLHRDLKLSEFERKIGMKELLMRKCIKAYPVLKEEQGKIVSQAENSFIVHNGKIIKLV